MNQKIEEINRLRAQLLNEMHSNGEGEAPSPSLMHGNKSFIRMQDIKIACIMDEFTFNCFAPECNLQQVTPSDWKNELEVFQPDMFFLESAWRGLNGLWKAKIDYFSDELIELLSYCKVNNIPVIFWNKEDPVFHDTFQQAARYADYVFTTDIDCVKSYKTIVNHDRVFLLPFAAQTKYHNPIERFERENKFCFAGAYYKRYKDRTRDLETFVDAITSEKQLDIYDRNYFDKNTEYRFPRKYRTLIKGYLKANDIGKAYKGYRFNVNMNSVKQSQSMCARRVFELLASNTVTFSNYSRAIRNLLGDLVICTDDGRRIRDEIRKFDDAEYYNKFRLVGLRKVLSEHTYRIRFAYIIEKVFGKQNDFSKRVAVVAKAGSKEDINRIREQFNKQTYTNKRLYICAAYEYVSDDEVELFARSEEAIVRLREESQYIAILSIDDYYGSNYLQDLVLALEYGDETAITKATYFAQVNDRVVKQNSDNSYKYVESACVRRSLLTLDRITNADIERYIENVNDAEIGSRSLSIDEYNYAMNVAAAVCKEADDLRIQDTGIVLSSLDHVVESIHAGNAMVTGSIRPLNESECYLSKSKSLLIVDDYPSYSDLYRNGFIHSRVVEYHDRGHSVDVFRFSERHRAGFSEFNGIDIASGYYEEINHLLFYAKHNTVLLHFLTKALWDGIKSSVKGKRIVVWVHGAEIQPWWRRKHNFQARHDKDALQHESEQRLAFWRELFHLAKQETGYDLHFVFVSQYLVATAFEDLNMDLPLEKFSIIHNYINGEVFKYRTKDRSLRTKILSIRPFANHNYGNDLTVKTILLLSSLPIFRELEFRIIGKGELFKETVKPIRKFKNVIIEERFLRQEEIAELHQHYGVFLVPTRMDSQGVSRDEAMSSGLVPITTNVAAIPEFVDSSCGMLVDAEDFHGLADCIIELYQNPDLFERLSWNASQRVRVQSGVQQTIIRELELLK
ncbi:glycosyltransferase [Paenibacillus lycopersici]|uniref:Glycosyltransferase n=1 Tax=Paenibacillus lycopersici TaxID=2704462 RepID=A0A6C0FQV4_9BACL|nr:glycosyltransferase [Paenibacillus lycopersici]QHT59267.1 glycosyltransferase [Paenibacillus lycopersici]